MATTDLAAAWTRIEALGPLVLVGLLPFPLALACDADAWRHLLAAIDVRVRLRDLFAVRLVTEAITNSAPAGAFVADAMGPLLLARAVGTPVPEVVATQAAKRWLVVRMHGVYVAVATILGWAALQRASRHLLHNDGLIFVLFATSVGLMTASAMAERALAGAKIAGRLHTLLERISTWPRLARVARWLGTRKTAFGEVDARIGRLSRDKAVARRAEIRLLGLWLVESVETFVLLRLLGANLGWFEVMSFDAALSVLRSAAVFAPAGIGVQDVGYLVVLEAYGVPVASGIAPAFVVMKRMKEIAWIAVGYGVLAISRRRHNTAYPPAAT